MPPTPKTTLGHWCYRHVKMHLSLNLFLNSCSPDRSLTKAANKIKRMSLLHETEKLKLN